MPAIQAERASAPRTAARGAASSQARRQSAASRATAVTSPLNFVSRPRPSSTPVTPSAASERRAERSLATKDASAAAPSSVAVISLPGIGLMKYCTGRQATLANASNASPGRAGKAARASHAARPAVSRLARLPHSMRPRISSSALRACASAQPIR